MLFSSITFLYYFLPVVLLIYLGTPRKFKNMVLLFASLFFYFWGEPLYVLLMIGSTLSGWLFGFAIEKHRGDNKYTRSKAALIGSLVMGLGLLALFKYSDFLIDVLNSVLTLNKDGPQLKALGLALPIGISFYTFQILSYTIDLYRGEAKLQRNFFSFATYVTLFPQLIAGPIVRYTTIAEALDNRRHSLQDVSQGLVRFVVGLGKKVLLANILGELCEVYKDSSEKSVLFTWLYVVAFGLHIYFDFSGYSDMGIGLGRVLGFHFLENFNYPYIANSVTDFWRRWHISLGSWFRDYVYIPLGGNRTSSLRHVFNILIVWCLTGFWHGAGWTFIFWGLYFAILLLVEKYFLKGVIQKLPAVVTRLYMLFAVLISWMLFDAETLSMAFERIGMLFGSGANSLAGETSIYYLRSYLVPLLVACAGATPLPKRLFDKLSVTAKGAKILTILEPLGVGVLLLVITAYLVDGSFNPFIYFRF